MKNKDKNIYARYMALLAVSMIFIVNIIGNGSNLNEKNSSEQILVETTPLSSGIELSPFTIDDSGSRDYTRAEAIMEPWCSGSGTELNPYTIESLSIDSGDFHDRFGTNIITIEVSDGELTDPASFTIIKNSVNEIPIANAGGSYVVDEGTEIVFNASASSGTGLQYRWDFEDDGNWDTTWSVNPTAKNTWYDDYSGTVLVEVNDSSDTDNDTASVIVNNVAPIIEQCPDYFVNEGSSVSISTTYSDPGSDPHTARIRWSPGGSLEAATVSGTTIGASHVYMSYGIYIVTLLVSDGDDEIGITFTVTVLDINDTTPPDAPSPDDGVSGWSNDSTPEFSWGTVTDTSGITGYWYAVDDSTPESGGTWTTTKPITLPAQSDGSHTFYIKTENEAGLLSSAGSHVFSIDATPPGAPSPDDGVSGWSNDSTPEFSWGAITDTSPITGYWYDVNNPNPESVGTFLVGTMVTLPTQSDGSHTFYIKTENEAGLLSSAGSHVFSIDVSPKIILINPIDDEWYLPGTLINCSIYDGSGAGLDTVKYYWSLIINQPNWETEGSDWVSPYDTTIPSGILGDIFLHIYVNDTAGNEKRAYYHFLRDSDDLSILEGIKWSISPGDVVLYHKTENGVYSETKIVFDSIFNNTIRTWIDGWVLGTIVNGTWYTSNETHPEWTFDPTKPSIFCVSNKERLYQLSESYLMIFPIGTTGKILNNSYYGVMSSQLNLYNSYYTDTYFEIDNGTSSDYCCLRINFTSGGKVTFLNFTMPGYTIELVMNYLPQANFTYIVNNDTITVTDTSVSGDGITSYQWDWDDGSINSTTPNPSHIYVYSGDYNVTLTVMDNDGDTNIITKTISVEIQEEESKPPDPPILITGNVTINTDSIEIQWSASTGATLYNVYVNGVLNETTSSTSQNIILWVNGTYYITVKAVNASGVSAASDTITITVEILLGVTPTTIMTTTTPQTTTNTPAITTPQTTTNTPAITTTTTTNITPSWNVLPILFSFFVILPLRRYKKKS